MVQTTSIIQNVNVIPNGSTIIKVIPPGRCFRCTIFYTDDTATSDGYISTTGAAGTYLHFATQYTTDIGATPTLTQIAGIINQPLVLDRRGVGYMNDEFSVFAKGPANNSSFIFIWEIEQ